MNHIDEIKLELYILNSPSITNERAEIEAHLAECNGCKELFDIIAGFYTEVNQDLASSENLPMPRPAETPTRRFYPLEQKYQNLSPFRRFAVGIPLRMARWMVHHPYAAGGATVMFSSFVVFALITMFKPISTKPRDMNPTNVVFAGETMFVRNAKGDTIDTELVGIRFAENQKGNAAAGNPQLIKFFDVNNDGINEIIWAQGPWEQNGNNSIIYCKSIIENRILWSDTMKKKLDFVSQAISDDKFVCTELLIDDFGNNGKSSVIALAKCSFFPTLIFNIDGFDGKINDEYLHMGGLEKIITIDINNDGIKDIIACGVNNSLGSACLLVLDPRFISGHSPLVETDAVRDFQPAKEQFYLLLPKTTIGKLSKSTTDWNRASDISDVNENERTFKVCVVDQTLEASEAITLYIYFDFDLKPTSFQTNDLFDRSARILFEKDLIRSLPDKNYWDNYCKSIQYWDGDEWHSFHTQNKYYLSSVNKYYR
jgi:hypothetical protein